MNGKLFYPVDISLKYWVETGGVFKHLWWRFLIAHIVDWQELTPETLLFSKWEITRGVTVSFIRTQ
jgi:hypothetical protein